MSYLSINLQRLFDIKRIMIHYLYHIKFHLSLIVFSNYFYYIWICSEPDSQQQIFSNGQNQWVYWLQGILTWLVQPLICEKNQNGTDTLEEWQRFNPSRYSNQFLIIYKKPCANTNSSQKQKKINAVTQAEAISKIVEELNQKKKIKQIFLNLS